MPSSNIRRRAISIVSRRASESMRRSLIRCLRSVLRPISGILDLRSKHHGHGHRARYRRHAISILRISHKCRYLYFNFMSHLLFGVICRVYEESRKSQSHNSIHQLEYEPMDIDMHEVVVHQQHPYSIGKLSAQMGKHGGGRCLSECFLIELLDPITKLQS